MKNQVIRGISSSGVEEKLGRRWQEKKKKDQQEVSGEGKLLEVVYRCQWRKSFFHHGWIKANQMSSAEYSVQTLCTRRKYRTSSDTSHMHHPYKLPKLSIWRIPQQHYQMLAPELINSYNKYCTKRHVKKKKKRDWQENFEKLTSLSSFHCISAPSSTINLPRLISVPIQPCVAIVILTSSFTSNFSVS